jgi:hypothetical protein
MDSNDELVARQFLKESGRKRFRRQLLQEIEDLENSSILKPFVDYTTLPGVKDCPTEFVRGQLEILESDNRVELKHVMGTTGPCDCAVRLTGTGRKSLEVEEDVWQLGQHHSANITALNIHGSHIGSVSQVSGAHHVGVQQHTSAEKKAALPPTAVPASMPPQSSQELPGEILLNVWAVRVADNGTVIEGTTNLPSNTKLGVELMTGERAMGQDFEVYVESGRFRSAAFRKGKSPLPPGKQGVHILTHFNTSWQSNDVLKLVGKGGSNLKVSAMIHSEDPQLTDGDKVLHYITDVLVPPLASASTTEGVTVPQESALNDKATEIVKKAVLVVDGCLSSMNVEDGAAFYLNAPGVRRGSGWSAARTTENAFTVALDFINTDGATEQHATAVWEVNIMTNEVLYRSKHAKAFSWIPKD